MILKNFKKLSNILQSCPIDLNKVCHFVKLLSYKEPMYDKIILTLQDIIINHGEGEYIYRFTKNIKIKNIAKLEKAVIDSDELDYIFLFARDVKNANIKLLQKALTDFKKSDLVSINMESDSYKAENIANFASNIKGADIGKLEDAICETSSIEYICEFAIHVNGANIDRLGDLICNSNDIDLICDFAENVLDANIDKIVTSVIKNNDANHMIKLASELQDTCHVTRLQTAVIETGNLSSIVDFAARIEFSDTKLLQYGLLCCKNHNSFELSNAIHQFAIRVQSSDTNLLQEKIVEEFIPEFMFKFARDVRSSNLKYLESKIIESKNARYVYEFAKQITESDTKKLQDCIIDCNEAEFIYMFARYIKNSNTNLLCSELIKTRNSKYLILFASNIKIQSKEIHEAILNFDSYDIVNEFIRKVSYADINFFRKRFPEFNSNTDNKLIKNEVANSTILNLLNDFKVKEIMKS